MDGSKTQLTVEPTGIEQPTILRASAKQSDTRLGYRVIKRGVDFACYALALVILLPVFLVT